MKTKPIGLCWKLLRKIVGIMGISIRAIVIDGAGVVISNHFKYAINID